MTYKEFIRKSDNAYRKRDIILLSELLDLYDEYYKSIKKELIDPIIVYNEIHDDLSYSKEEIEIIIQQAQKTSKINNRFCFFYLRMTKNKPLCGIIDLEVL